MENSKREQDTCTAFNVDCFYGKAQQTRDQVLHVAKSVKHMEQNPLPCNYHPGILGPPTTWKTFSRQSEAIKFAQEHGDGLMVFSFEGDAIGEGGKRNYVVTHPSMMWIRHCGRLPNQRCTYEVIQEQSVCKLYFDLEFLYTYNPKRDGVSMTNTFIQIVCYFLHKEFNIFCTRKHILDLSSTSSSKFSRHLIFNIPGTAFATNIHVGHFVVMICNKIRDWVKKRETVNVPGITLSDIKNLFVLDSKYTEVLFCDEGVYTRNRNFRMFQSTKLGKNSPLIISPENEYVPNNKYGVYQEEKIFQDSLITLVENGCRVLRYGESCHHVRSKTKNDNKKHLEIEGCSQSPYPEIDNYIQTIIGSGYIRCWYYFSQSERLVYEIALNRFCYNIGREHKSNGIMYVVDLKSAMYYQKCHDPDCKEFRSEAWPLPENTVFWQNMTDNDMIKWLHSVNDCDSDDDDDRMLLTALSQVEMEDVSDEQLVIAAEAFEMWDKLDHALNSSCSLQGSQQNSYINFPQKGNAWERLSFVSTRGSSFFDELSHNITQDLDLSQHHLEAGLYRKTEADKEFAKAAADLPQNVEDFVNAAISFEDDSDDEFTRAATVVEEQILNQNYEMEFIC